MFKLGTRKWQATNADLQVSNWRGLAFRNSKHLADIMAGQTAMVKWGDRIRGIDEGDGWLRCEFKVQTHVQIDACTELPTKDAGASSSADTLVCSKPHLVLAEPMVV